MALASVRDSMKFHNPLMNVVKAAEDRMRSAK
jgi:hypothetical protein